MSPCPTCGGIWLYGLTWQHSTSCVYYERDSATAAADHQSGSGIREISETELVLVGDQDGDPPADDLGLGVAFEHRGVHRRRLIWIDDTGSFAGELQDDE